MRHELREAILDSPLTLKQIARRLPIGSTETDLALIVLGHRAPGVMMRRAIAKALGMPEVDLFPETLEIGEKAWIPSWRLGRLRAVRGSGGDWNWPVELGLHPRVLPRLATGRPLQTAK